MQIRKQSENDRLIFASVLQAGINQTAEYDAVYDKNTQILHVYDDLKHYDTSIINNNQIDIKNHVLEHLGYSDGIVKSLVNKLTGKADNNDKRMIIYIANMVHEIGKGDELFSPVEDETLLYPPYLEKVKNYVW